MPLILPSQRVIRPNPLAYPAGAVPGIDRSHPAARNLWLSTISTGGTVGGASTGPSYINLLTGKVSLAVDGVTATVPVLDGAIGPSGFIPNASGDGAQFTGPANTPAFETTACIIRPISIGSGSTYYGYVTTYNGGSNRALYIKGAQVEYFSVVDYLSGITLTNGVPYFIAASYTASSAGSDAVIFAVTNLMTGAIQTASVAGNNAAANIVSIAVGGNSPGTLGGASGRVAAAMYSQTRLSFSQLVAWAQDPWSFWYPRRTIQYTTPATTTSGGARIRQRFNRSPLAYPAGAVPGIDRSHPASLRCYLSAIASGPNYINLITGAPCVNTAPSQTTAITPSISGGIGPGIAFPSDTCPSQGIDFVGSGSNITVSAVTIAAILKCPTANASFSEIVGTRDTGDGFRCSVYLNGSNELVLAFPTSVHSGLTPTVGQYYFIAVSTPAVATQPVFFLLKNLTTGQVLTSSVVQGFQTTFNFRYIFIGNDKGGASCQAPIAAGMLSETVVTPAQLLAWSADPWSFWYPNKTINLASSTASAGASFLPVWAYRYNLPVLGTGNF